MSAERGGKVITTIGQTGEIMITERRIEKTADMLEFVEVHIGHIFVVFVTVRLQKRVVLFTRVGQKQVGRGAV